jgi:hypothetical protein
MTSTTIKIKKTHDIKEYKKKYWEENKEKLNEKITCEICGAKLLKRNIKEHNNSTKHKYFELQQKLNIIKNI